MEDILTQIATGNGFDAANNPLLADLLSTVRLTFQVVAAVLLVMIFFVGYRFSRLRQHQTTAQHVREMQHNSAVASNRIGRQWGKIKARLELPTEAEWKIAVIEADNLVDDLLRRMGYSGTTMGERLKTITPAQLASINAIWEAHKLRNKIVHEPDSRLLHRDARVAIQNFETFLREAHVLE